MASDVSILFGILLFLILLGIFLPQMQDALGPKVSTIRENITALDPESGGNWISSSSNAFVGIMTALFWTFNWFPIWLQALHIVIRIIAIFIGVRLFRGTG